MSWRLRLRWRLAQLLDRLPGQCWTDLADWALRYPGGRFPIAPNRDCRRSAAENRHGVCYCGKIRLTEPAATGGASDG